VGDVQPEGRGLAPDTVKAPASEHPSTVKTFGVAALALLLYLLLADVAIETFWSGAPVRWWVLGVVTVFLVGVLVVWRSAPTIWKRMTPAVHATSGAGVFLVLLAATVWLPGGLDNGVRLAGQPTSVVLALLSTCAVILAGTVVLRLRAVPLWARLALAALAAYACAGFVVGLLRSTPFLDLFHGLGFWSRLPVWLQGPRLGAFVVLPLGAIALALTWLKHRGEARTSTSTLQPAMLLLAAFAASLAAVSAAGGANPLGVAPGTVDLANRSSPSPDPSRPVVAGSTPTQANGQAASTTEDVATLLQKIEVSQAKMPRDRFDPAVIVAGASGDPAKLMAWVRDNTRLVSYAGSLRGALGVLMDRNGNSLDRSVLLVRLLALARFDARIVSAKLSGAESAKLLAGSPNPFPAAPPEDDARAKQRRDLKEEASRISKMILGEAGPLSLASAGANESMHYWVQFNDGKAWADLDPTLASPRQSRAQPEGNPLALDPSTHGIARSSGLLHSVNMSLLVERWEAGKLIESPLLSVPFDSSKEPLGSVTLTFVPVEKKKAVPRPFATGAELRTKLSRETAWAPIIAEGSGGGRVARMFDDAGVVGDLPKGNVAPSAVGGVFGSFMGGADDKANAATVLTAVIADYQISTPGKPTRHVRRFIFDSIGPEARRRTSMEAIPKPAWTDQQRLDRGVELAAQNDTLILFAGLPSELYIYRFAQRAIEAKAATIKASQGPVDDATAERVADGISFRTLELYSASRDSSIHPELVIAEPQIVRRVIRYLPNTNAKALDVQVIGDLAWNRLSTATGLVAATTASTIVDQGVLDTLLEHVIVFRGTPALPGQTTSALFAEAARQGIGTIGLRDPNDAALANYPISTREMMRMDLQAGQCVIAPSKPVLVDGQPRLGWWRVDPASAQTVGEMDTGLLQETTEYSTTESVNGMRITRVHRVRISPEVRSWAEHAIRNRGNTSWSQWENLLSYGQKMLDTTAYLGF